MGIPSRWAPSTVCWRLWWFPVTTARDWRSGSRTCFEAVFRRWLPGPAASPRRAITWWAPAWLAQGRARRAAHCCLRRSLPGSDLPTNENLKFHSQPNYWEVIPTTDPTGFEHSEVHGWIRSGSSPLASIISLKQIKRLKPSSVGPWLVYIGPGYRGYI